MTQTARRRRRLIGGLAAGVVAAAGLAGGTASAEPLFPSPPSPAPAPAAVPVTPNAVGTNPAALAPPATFPRVPGAPVPPVQQPVLTPARAGTLRDYFAAKNVALEPQKPQGFDALDITLPVPPGWTQVPDPNVVDAFAVIADRHADSLYTPNAQVVVYKLVGDFDPAEAISHGYVDSQQQLGWRTTNASLAPFGGFPSSLIEGTYRQDAMTLNTSQRYVIATSGSDRYLVSLAVTTAATRAIAAAPATDAIINGFRVAAPTTAHAPAPPPGPAGVPGAPAVPAPPRAPGFSG
ncbi:LpqN/LpqT family lipoprotein [Mycobacterium sp. pUA109]|uniref:LpqN/LpqT family lipoprotein n=1 Tax=Mycobacterium sp. pUA109 TaxID=3238982 RepID=UPI00351AFAF0